MDDLKIGDKLFSIQHNMWFTIIFIFKESAISKVISKGNLADLNITSDERFKDTVHINKGINYSEIGENYLTEIQYKVKRRNSIIEDLI